MLLGKPTMRSGQLEIRGPTGQTDLRVSVVLAILNDASQRPEGCLQ